MQGGISFFISEVLVLSLIGWRCLPTFRSSLRPKDQKDHWTKGVIFSFVPLLYHTNISISSAQTNKLHTTQCYPIDALNTMCTWLKNQNLRFCHENKNYTFAFVQILLLVYMLMNFESSLIKFVKIPSELPIIILISWEDFALSFLPIMIMVVPLH